MLARTCFAALALMLAAPPPGAAAGTIAHYVRTGLDGAQPEHVWVYRPGGGRAEVYKMQSRCTSAALVTAEMDEAGRELRTIVGGRLRRDGTQQPVARLSLDPAARRLDVRVDLPDRTLTQTLTIGPAPLWLYDFDAADLAVGGPRAERSLAFAWPEGDAMVVSPGRADLTLVGDERREGRAVKRYRVAGPAFAGDLGGDLWIDAASGRLVDAEIGRPNHPGYKGLRLKLEAETPGDDAAWRARLLSHFEGCPAPP